MGKMTLKCTCPICGEVHELEADMLIPGVQGVINRPDGRPMVILDPTKTDRHCKICAELLVRDCVDAAMHLEVEDE